MSAGDVLVPIAGARVPPRRGRGLFEVTPRKSAAQRRARTAPHRRIIVL